MAVQGIPVSLARLKELLHYCPETGVFTWLVSMPPRGAVGSSAGTVAKNGYRYISINARRYLAHRLAWFYQTGDWPRSWIDHKNRNQDDNRLSNLREATPSQNAGNQKRRIDAPTEFKGVSKKRDRWQARIRLNGRTKSLGVFATPGEAGAAYAAAANLHFQEFALVN